MGDWADRLRTESEAWVRQGLISEMQRGAILRLYPAEGAVSRDRTVLIFSILGSLLVGAGVILYFAAAWPRIPAGWKVLAMVTATLASYGAGFFFQFRAPLPAWASRWSSWEACSTALPSG